MTNPAPSEASLTALADAKLSDRAMAVCGAWFSMMSPGKGELTFELRTGRPSEEALAGLNELVRAGVVSVEPFNKWGGLVYRPLVDCHDALGWLRKNISKPAARIKTTQPLVGGETEACAVQAAALASNSGGE